MAGLTRLYGAHIGRAAVDAFKAGNDLLIIPAGSGGIVSGSVGGRPQPGDFASQLDASVLNIESKGFQGLNKGRRRISGSLLELVGQPANVALGQRVSDDTSRYWRDGSVPP